MRACHVLTAICACATALVAADSPFTGTWKLNTAKSKSTPGTAIQEMTMIFEPVGDQWKRVATGTDSDGKAFNENSTIAWDGKDHAVDEPGITVAVTQVNDRTLNVTVKHEGAVVDSVHVVISNDRKTMAVSEKGQDPKGRKLDNVEVFEKQ
ncbi:MAG: hypothetical protein JWP08_789 [Bryobacterales bacterium]|jgi:hypothetical protein|nr:hypothetical protein [Bryobacterales bacterium]